MTSTATLKWLQRLALVIGVVVGATALAGLGAGLFGPPKPALAFLAFELTILVSGMFCILLGLGRFRVDAAMTLLCIGGVCAVAGAFGFVSLGPVRSLGAMPVIPLAAGQVLAGLGLIGVAVIVVLNGHRAAWRLLLIGGALSLPAIVVALAFITGRPRGILSAINASPSLLKVILALVGGVMFIALASAAGHLIIRAFQTAIEPKPPAPSKA